MGSVPTNPPASLGKRREHVTKRLAVLGVALLGLELLARCAHERNDLNALVLLLLASGMTFAVAVWEVHRSSRERRHTLLCILAFAGLYRAALAPLNPPRLSTDVYRYVWDGRVQGAGINPYLYPPADPKLGFLRDRDIYPNINRKEYARTIYPPTAQLFFWLVTRLRASILGMKAAMAAVDFGTVLLLVALLSYAGLPRKRVLVYAWHPLPIWEFAGAGHVDALMLLLTVASFAAFCGRRPALAGGILAAAALTKFLPFALLPALFRRGRWKWGLVVPVAAVGLYLPYASQAGSKVLGFLPQYTHEEGLAEGDRFYLLRLANVGASMIAGRSVRFPPMAFLVVAFLAYVALVVPFTLTRDPGDGADPGVEARRWPDVAPSARKIQAVTVFVCVMLSSNYPWYYSWVVPWLVLVPNAPALLMTLAVFVLYRSIDEPAATDTFWFHSQLFLPVLTWVTYRFINRQIRPSPLIHEL
jgi:alpha-1,6-mannosyltransferase